MGGFFVFPGNCIMLGLLVNTLKLNLTKIQFPESPIWGFFV